MLTTRLALTLLLFTSALALAAGCTLDLEAPGSQISCDRDQQCPAGWRCDPTLRRCLDPNDPDSTAPAVVAASISPDVGREGTELVIQFSVDELLGTEPVVTVRFGSTAPATPLEGGATAATEFRYTYTATGQEPDLTGRVEALLVDDSGNAATSVVGNLALDFDPPTLTGLRWTTPSLAVQSSSAPTARGTVSDDAIQLQGTLLDASGALIAEVAVSRDAAGTEVFATIDLDVLAVSDGDAIRLQVTAWDAAGNAAEATTPALSVDDRPPAVEVVAPGSPTTAVDVDVAFSSPDVDVAAFFCSMNGASFAPCTSPLALRDVPVGGNTLAIEAVDEAGNRKSPGSVVAWTVVRAWSQVSAGGAHTCVVATDHTLWCWGENRVGTLGNGSSGPGSALGDPAQVRGPVFWRRVSAGEAHSCAIDRDEQLWCWGSDAAGQLGVGAFPYPEARKDMPARVGDDTDWIVVAAGTRSTCGVRRANIDSGTLWCWGRDVASANEKSLSNVPAQIGTEEDWLDVAVGPEHVCGIRDDSGTRTAHCFGRRDNGRLGAGDLGIGVVTSPVVVSGAGWVALAAGERSTCGINAEGLWCWGAYHEGFEAGDGAPEPVDLSGGESWAGVAMTHRHLCARTMAGAVACLGSNAQGAIDPIAVGASPEVLTEVSAAATAAQVAAGRDHTCIVTPIGAVRCFGRNDRGQLGQGAVLPDTGFVVEVAGTGWQGITAGDRHTCAIQSGDRGGSLWCWGDNNNGQLGLDDQIPRDEPTQVGKDEDWLSVSAGGAHTCGVRDTRGSGTVPGSLFCWGANDFGQAEEPVTSPVVLTPTQVGPADAWTAAVAAGRDFSCAVQEDGSLWCWGRNDIGQAGIGTTSDPVETATLVDHSLTWVTLDASEAHACAIDDQTRVYCWGSNSQSRAGASTGSALTTPTQVANSGSGWSSVTLGKYHSCGMRGSQARCWGDGRQGQLQFIPEVLETAEPVCLVSGSATCSTYYSPVAAASYFTCAQFHLFDPVEIRCTGEASWGTGAPLDARTDFGETFSSGAAHLCALTGSAGSIGLACWGENTHGQLGAAGLWRPAADVAAPQTPSR